VEDGPEVDDVDGGQAAWPPRSLAERLAFLLKHAQMRVVALAEPALEPLGIDGREFGLLVFFAGEAPMSQQEAAQRLGIDRTTMVALIDGLEGQGLVGRRPHPDDRRKNTVGLTKAGRDRLAKAKRSIESAEQTFLAPLSATDAKQFVYLLQTLVAAAD
jgi:DNA-binding MarR family transcriptional regulator